MEIFSYQQRYYASHVVQAVFIPAIIDLWAGMLALVPYLICTLLLVPILSSKWSFRSVLVVFGSGFLSSQVIIYRMARGGDSEFFGISESVFFSVAVVVANGFVVALLSRYFPARSVNDLDRHSRK